MLRDGRGRPGHDRLWAGRRVRMTPRYARRPADATGRSRTDLGVFEHTRHGGQFRLLRGLVEQRRSSRAGVRDRAKLAKMPRAPRKKELDPFLLGELGVLAILAR